MNVKKICWGLSLLTCFNGFAGCSDDEEGFNENVILRNDFTNTEGEVIDFVLQDQPACLTGIGDSGVSFCYADYVYEYWFDAEAFQAYNFSREEVERIDENVMNMRFLVTYDNFKEFNLDISPGTKVYVSAEITNIGRISDGRDWQELEGRIPIIRKAYLTGLKVRND